MKEKKLLNEIMMAISNTASRLFRNNIGKCWIGPVTHREQNRKGLAVVICPARRFNAGLIKGSSDLIGWTPVQITPDMVGKTVAIFTAIEVKAGSTRTTPEQTNFITQVNKNGGLAGIAKSVEDAEKIIKK